LAISSTITVELGERSYPIVIGNGLLGHFELGGYLGGPDCLLVTNDTVGPLYLETVKKKLPSDSIVVSLPDGEQHKTLKSAARVLDELVASHANRDTTVVALARPVSIMNRAKTSSAHFISRNWCLSTRTH
jgi:3-dehydroquinate synthase